MPTSESPLVTYNGNCHCGLVKFTATLPDIRSGKVVQCNCSICTKNGYLLVYPNREDVKFISGQDKLASYRFSSGRKPHNFCPQCGTSILIDFSDSEHEVEQRFTAVNVRTILEHLDSGCLLMDLLDPDFCRRGGHTRQLGPESCRWQA